MNGNRKLNNVNYQINDFVMSAKPNEMRYPTRKKTEQDEVDVNKNQKKKKRNPNSERFLVKCYSLFIWVGNCRFFFSSLFRMEFD